MKSQTSNAVFLGGVMASIAVVSLIAAPAYGAEPVPAQTQAVETTEAATPETVCVDAMCYTLPSTEVVIEAEDFRVVDDGAVTATTYRATADAPLIMGDDFADMDTMIGKIDRTAPDSAADQWLSGQDYMPTNGEILEIEAVTGVGLRRTF